jgi:hypothetical protein
MCVWFTHECEVWQMKQKIKTSLTLEMDFWRRSARTSRRENFRNEIIRKKLIQKYNS